MITPPALLARLAALVVLVSCVLPARAADEEVDPNIAFALPIERLSEGFNRDELGDYAAKLAMWTMSRIMTGEIEIQGRDASALIDVLVKVVRLEEGQSTDNSLRVTVSADEARARLQGLRAQGQAPMPTSETPPVIETTAGEHTPTATNAEGTTHPPGGQGGTPGSTPPDDV